MKFELNMHAKEKTRGGIVLVSFACACLAPGLMPALAQPATPAAETVVIAPAPVPGNTAAEAFVAALPSASDTTVPPENQPLDETMLLAMADAKSSVRDASVLPEALTTLFFTAWQHALLQEAKIGFNTSLATSGTGGGDDQSKRDPGLREISLGGIAFADSSKWTVWLNGVRVTPTAIPEQVLDIKVSRAYVDVKWFDGYTNKIYPIRLRPQERFNLDSRIFLPGAGVDGEGAL